MSAVVFIISFLWFMVDTQFVGLVNNNLLDDMYELTSRASNEESKCLAMNAGFSENFDEKHIVKDVKTSFIPAGPTYARLNCEQNNLLSDPPFDQNMISNSATVFNRQARSFRKVETTPIHRSNEAKIMSDASTVSALHGFWKGEGSRNSIRTMQANIMEQYMDETMEPCTDFYQYACGNWAKLNPIPKDKAGFDTFEMLRESLDLVLRDLLSEVVVDRRNSSNTKSTRKDSDFEGASEYLQNVSIAKALQHNYDMVKLEKLLIQKREIVSKIIGKIQRRKRRRRKRQITKFKHHNQLEDAEQKAKDLFASCMNSELLESRGIAPLLDLLKSLGGWPILNEDWNESRFDWLDLVAKLRLYNNDVLIVQWVGPDIKNSDENIIQFDQTTLGLPTREYFLHKSNSQYLKAYQIFMQKVMQLVGATLDSATETAEEVVQFETELAKITSSSEDRSNVTSLYKQMTLQDLHQLVPEIDWVRYLSIVQERSVSLSEVIVIYAVNYMENLVTLLGKTNPKTIANYSIWRFVRHRINNLDDRFQEAKQQFFNVLFGREQSPPRWQNCVGQVNSNMGMALGAMFVRKYFDENSKNDTMKMTHELQEAFREILNTTEWLDETTKYLAVLKVNSMSLKIGYPDFILSKSELNKRYEGLEIDREKYFENTLNILRHVARTEQSKLNQPVNKTIWQTAPAIVNAYYSRNKNQIMFPAGILQPPFYHRYFPKSLNFGGIGVVIGHELTHGFDDKGRLFDRKGNIHKWWSDYAINGFHERAQCLIAQYGNYTVSEVGIPIDGESTQGENIADNGGIRQAFRAYQKWLSKNAGPNLLERETLPGLAMTPNQLFFLNFAQVWCGAMRPEATRNKLKTAVHSPGKFRVIGTLSNSVDFSREFRCEPGTPMNPIRKCSVW